jgi:hypothetical protein
MGVMKALHKTAAAVGAHQNGAGIPYDPDSVAAREDIIQCGVYPEVHFIERAGVVI